MCGIAGTFAYHPAANAIDKPELMAMRDHMAARGPDGAGEWLAADGRIGLGHRRLAIIDLTEAGAQPMISADGMTVVTFNGEIYNHRELRRRLEERGARFRSRSDTEVLLHLYAAYGDGHGRAASRHVRLRHLGCDAHDVSCLARDPLGIKPLYYADDGWTLRFASQVKALLAPGSVSRDPDPAGWAGFYLFGSVPEPYTTYRAIRAVPAGATVLIDRLGCCTRRANTSR